MRIKQLLTAALLVTTAFIYAQPQIVAHRGYWQSKGATQNGFSALVKAQSEGYYGAEFDVLVSADGVPVINHDPVINRLKIEETLYADLKNCRFDNGEFIPTLESFLRSESKRGTRYVIEIKSHSTPELERKAVRSVVEVVNRVGCADQVDYISFSLLMCKELVAGDPSRKVYYLSGDLSPKQIKELGLTGIDYHYDVFAKNPTWIQEAHALGLKVNVWTVNSAVVMQRMIDNQVDFITTDEPQLLRGLLIGRGYDR